MTSRTLKFVTTHTDCYVPISHKLNKDGYFRKRWADDAEMFHRFIYRAHHGEIPRDHDVHHKCNNRACSNPDHLELMEGLSHTILTNTERYADRKEAARLYWAENRITGTALGDMFDVSFSSACSWIREWKANETV